MSFRSAAVNLTLEIPEELRRKPWGRRGKGTRSRQRKAKAWRRRRRLKPYLLSLIMGKVRSLANKMNELTALARSQREFRRAALCAVCIMTLGCPWPERPSLPDWDYTGSSKKKEGGLAILVNNRWCHPGHITVHDRIARCFIHSM